MNVAQARAALSGSPLPSPAPATPGAPPTGTGPIQGQVVAPSAPPVNNQASLKLVAKTGTSMVTIVCGAIIKRRGYEPNQPADDEIEMLESAIFEGLQSEFENIQLPWYVGICLASAGLYTGMRVGAKKLGPPEPSYQPTAPAPAPPMEQSGPSEEGSDPNEHIPASVVAATPPPMQPNVKK